jgi:hypothetical protein
MLLADVFGTGDNSTDAQIWSWCGWPLKYAPSRSGQELARKFGAKRKKMRRFLPPKFRLAPNFRLS